jgi:hypothetical protein
MKDNIAQHTADAGAALSTAAVATYSFTEFLNDAALVVAIVSGSLAAAWHVYKFYQEYKQRGNNASTQNIQRSASKRPSDEGSGTDRGQ